MAQVGVYGPYSTIAPWLTAPPGWVPEEEKDRIGSYDIYEGMYWSHVDAAYRVMTRDTSEENPVYTPLARLVVETVNRYAGANLQVVVEPESGTPATRELARQTISALLRRERFMTRYNANKRYGSIRGDWLWHIIADPAKPQGSRLRIMAVDARSYFPVYESDVISGGDPERVMKVRLAERIQVGDEWRVRVQVYEWGDDRTTIYTSAAIWEEDKWFGEDESPESILLPPTPLPPQITSIPVYHIPHNYTPGEPFGSSEIRGLEVLAAGLNQSVTDEDLALALIGLGVYATDQPGSPIDPTTGEGRDWFIYPGAVIENSKGLRRVEGITSVAPYSDHLSRLEKWAREATAATETASGNVDVQVAESGVALALRLGPILAKAAEIDQVIADVLNQMFFDLRQWLLVYEGVNIMDVTLSVRFGDKIPLNRRAEAEMVLGLVTGGVMSSQTARQYLSSHGFADAFAPDEEERVFVEAQMRAQADQGLDPLAVRTAAEQEGSVGPTEATAGASTPDEGTGEVA